MQITNQTQAFEALNAAHAYLNSCDDDGYLSDELIALEDAIAALHVAFDKAEESRVWNLRETIAECRRHNAHIRADLMERGL